MVERHHFADNLLNSCTVLRSRNNVAASEAGKSGESIIEPHGSASTSTLLNIANDYKLTWTLNTIVCIVSVLTHKQRHHSNAMCSFHRHRQEMHSPYTVRLCNAVHELVTKQKRRTSLEVGRSGDISICRCTQRGHLPNETLLHCDSYLQYLFSYSFMSNDFPN